MRIKLKGGKQRELILKAKGNFTWKKLSEKLNLSEGYLKNELGKEKRLCSEISYNSLCAIVKEDFDSFIIERLDDNWGRSKGGLVARKNLKEINNPEKNGDLSEIIGIILGDGHVCSYARDKKIGNYFIRIAGNSETDMDYIKRYIPQLFNKVFEENGHLHFSKDKYVGYFTIYGKNYVDLMVALGIRPGNKKDNNQGLPEWIRKNPEFLSRCIRGLIDTDGSIHKIAKDNYNLRIDYTSYIPKLITDVRESFIELGFSPSKIINRKHFFLSKQEEVRRYINEVGFGNQKNLNRFKSFEKNAPIVQRPRMQPSQNSNSG